MTLLAQVKIATHTSDDEGNGLDDRWEYRSFRGAAAAAIRPEDFTEEFGTIYDAEHADPDGQTFPTMIILDRDDEWTDTSTGETYAVTHGTVVTIDYEDDRYDRD